MVYSEVMYHSYASSYITKDVNKDCYMDAASVYTREDSVAIIMAIGVVSVIIVT